MTELKDDFDFNTLDPGRWENLCFSLVHAKNPLVHTVDGRGGDGGIDAWVGSFESPTVIYQFKFFRNTFGKQQVKQVKDSLAAAFNGRSGFKWVLMCSKDPTPKAMEDLEKLKNVYPDTNIEYRFASDVAAMLIECPKVRKEYYPNMQDALEALCKTDGHKPTELIRKGAKQLNDIVLDDRLKATVMTDGNYLTTVYEVRPGVTEEVPLFRVTSKTEEGRDALMALQREGKPFKLTPDDIDIEALVSFPEEQGELVSVSAFSMPDPRPSSLFVYPGDATADAPRLFITLKTVRCGAQIQVCSNVDQEDCPIVLELECPTDAAMANGTIPELHTNITPRYEGCRVKVARKGSHFLADLAKTEKLGMQSPNDDDGDVAYCRFFELDTSGAWEGQATFFDAAWRACDFFGINPIVDDSFKTEEFFEALAFFVRHLDQQGKAWSGTLSFTLKEYNQSQLNKIDESGSSTFVVEETAHMELFGVYCEARIRAVSTGTLEHALGPDGLVCKIHGEHTVYMCKLLPE